MSRNKKELWTLENGEKFTITGKHYTFVGKYNTGFRFRCFAVNDASLNIEEFDGNTELYTKKVKKRDDFWYKRKFVELVYCTMEHHKVEVRFNKVCSYLNDTIQKGSGGRYGATLELSGEFCRSNYIMTANYKIWDGVTIMLINTVTGKSVSCKHINPDKVNRNNVQLIIFDLYKKYMNQ
jgi:RAB protein geranylgeranyltransferase component A